MPVNSTRKALVTILALMIICIVGVSFIYSFSQKKGEIKKKTESARSLLRQSMRHIANLENLEQEKEKLTAEASGLEALYYREDELDEYGFGLELRSLFRSMNIEVSQYHAITEKEKILLEYTLSGSIIDTLSLIRNITSHGKVWRIDFLTIKMRPDNKTADIVLRIGYETVS